MGRLNHSEINDLVARARLLKQQADEAEAAARAAIMSRFGAQMESWTPDQHEPIAVTSELGTSRISYLAGRETLDKAKVATFLTPGQFAQCLKVGEPSYHVRFAPAIRVKAA